MTQEEQEEQEEAPVSDEGGEGGGAGEESGPDVEDLNEDPAYNPDDENLKGLKGG